MIDVTERFEILGIKECIRCGKTGDDGEKYGVRGIARIGGNLCVQCVREICTESSQEATDE